MVEGALSDISIVPLHPLKTSIKTGEISHHHTGLTKEQFDLANRALAVIRLCRNAIAEPLDTARPLSVYDADALISEVRIVALKNGELFWKKNLSEADPDKTVFFGATHKAEDLMKKHLIPTQIATNTGSRHGIDNALLTFADFVRHYNEHGRPKSDDLGMHFAHNGKPHRLLQGISVHELQQKVREYPQGKIVLAAAASSGVVEAGIIANYMTHVLHIPTTIDPVFITKATHKHAMHSQPAAEAILAVIPIDDRVIFSGYSAVEAMRAAKGKYGDKVVVTKRMHLWELNQSRVKPINLKSFTIGKD